MQTINFIFDVASYITSPEVVWLPIAVLAAVAMILILGLIYMITSALGRTEFKTWIRVKIYDVLLSLLMIFIFFFIVTAYFDVNPVPYYETLGLVPLKCETVQDFFSLSACDMHEFISDSLQLNWLVYELMVVVSFMPSASINTEPLFATTVADYGFGVQLPNIMIFPVPVQFFVGDAVGALYPLLVLNDVQELLLTASLLIFSLLMTIGLIARIFGVSRTFGGSMIALAIGIGVLYPLLVSFSYGFLTAGIDASQTACGGLCPLNQADIGAVIDAIVGIFLAAGLLIGGPLSGPTLALLGNLISYIGIVLLGISLIPLLNFLILDTFVIDFSKAIGEKIDFMTLLTTLV